MLVTKLYQGGYRDTPPAWPMHCDVTKFRNHGAPWPFSIHLKIFNSRKVCTTLHTSSRKGHLERRCEFWRPQSSWPKLVYVLFTDLKLFCSSDVLLRFNSKTGYYLFPWKCLNKRWPEIDWQNRERKKKKREGKICTEYSYLVTYSTCCRAVILQLPQFN